MSHMVNGDSSPTLEFEEWKGRVMGLEGRYDKLETENRNLSFTVAGLTHEVKKLCLALGVAHRIPVPEDFEEITQVKRPALRKLERKAIRGKLAAVGTGLAWGAYEVIRFVLAHYQGSWH